MDLYRVLVAIRQLLAEPNPRDPLEVAIVSVKAKTLVQVQVVIRTLPDNSSCCW
jgi:ubiquitin-protein ligase